MESEKIRISELCSAFRLGGINHNTKEVIAEAEQQAMGYVEFLGKVLETEANYRSERDLNKREKTAWLPQMSDLDHYKTDAHIGISPVRLKVFESTKIDEEPMICGRWLVLCEILSYIHALSNLNIHLGCFLLYFQ